MILLFIFVRLSIQRKVRFPFCLVVQRSLRECLIAPALSSSSRLPSGRTLSLVQSVSWFGDRGYGVPFLSTIPGKIPSFGWLGGRSPELKGGEMGLRLRMSMVFEVNSPTRHSIFKYKAYGWSVFPAWYQLPTLLTKNQSVRSPLPNARGTNLLTSLVASDQEEGLSESKDQNIRGSFSIRCS